MHTPVVANLCQAGHHKIYISNKLSYKLCTKIWIRWNTPIHVDAASGGFIAPFLYPELEWDFRLPLVKSINVSGHKYGLVYAGIGWVIWRSKEDLPDELIFHINYLGSDQPTFTLNFSKGKQHNNAITKLTVSKTYV